MNRKYAIVCPGPSAEAGFSRWPLCASEYNSLIAVNGAVLYSFKYEWWVVQDFEVFEAVYDRSGNWPVMQLSHDKPLLFIPDRWLADIRKYNQAKQTFFDLYPKMCFPASTQAAFNESMPFGKDINWREYTVFMAIALAIKAGAQQIDLWGADMEAGYTQPGMENSKTTHNARRWKDEAEKLDRIINICQQHEITLKRIIGV